MHIKSHLFLFLSIYLFILGCSFDRGEENTGEVKREQQRWVSLAPSHCEWIFELQAQARLVGRSEQCDYPKEVNTVPSVGSLFPVRIDQILRYKPSHILMIDGHLELKAQLERFDIKVHQIQPKTLLQLFEQTQELGKIFGKQTQAEAWIKQAQSRLQAIKPFAQKPRVLIELWFSPLTIAGPESYMGDLLRIAGGQTLEIKGAWPTLDLEKVIRFDPQVLFVSTQALYNELRSDSVPKVWQAVSAVKHKKVFLLEGRLARPGPRIMDDLEWLHSHLNLADQTQ